MRKRRPTRSATTVLVIAKKTSLKTNGKENPREHELPPRGVMFGLMNSHPGVFGEGPGGEASSTYSRSTGRLSQVLLPAESPRRALATLGGVMFMFGLGRKRNMGDTLGGGQGPEGNEPAPRFLVDRLERGQQSLEEKVGRLIHNERDLYTKLEKEKQVNAARANEGVGLGDRITNIEDALRFVGSQLDAMCRILGAVNAAIHECVEQIQEEDDVQEREAANSRSPESRVVKAVDVSPGAGVDPVVGSGAPLGIVEESEEARIDGLLREHHGDPPAGWRGNDA